MDADNEKRIEDVEHRITALENQGIPLPDEVLGSLTHRIEHLEKELAEHKKWLLATLTEQEKNITKHNSEVRDDILKKLRNLAAPN
jgi:uncharacterized coiled-coil protein SlyX